MKKNKKLLISYSLVGLFIASCSSIQVTEEAVYEDSIQSIEVSSNRSSLEVPSSSRAVVANATVYFEFDKYNLSTRSIQALKSISDLMSENPSIEITIAGHADERGTREYNLALGERRANAAKDYLMTYGVSSDRIKVLSYGKERPVDSGSNPLSWSKNRRSVTVKAN